MSISTQDSDRSFGVWLGGIALAVVAAVTLFNVASAEAHTLDYRTARIVAADYARGQCNIDRKCLASEVLYCTRFNAPLGAHNYACKIINRETYGRCTRMVQVTIQGGGPARIGAHLRWRCG